MVGRPESSRFLVPSTTPGRGLPLASLKIDAALKPESVTVRNVWLRAKPNRNSFRRFGEKVCVSTRTPDRLIGVLLVPPKDGRTPAVTAVPSYSAHRPVR